MLRAEPFRQNKDWRYPVTRAEDYALFASLCSKVKFANIPEVLVDYYKSSQQSTFFHRQELRSSGLETSKLTIKRELGIETDDMPDWYFGVRKYDNLPYDLHGHLLGAARLFCAMEEANVRLGKFDGAALKKVLSREWTHIKTLCHFGDMPAAYDEVTTDDLHAAMKAVSEAEYPAGKVIIFGMGVSARSIIPRLTEIAPFNILAYSDSDPAKHGTDFMGRKVIPPALMAEFDYDHVLIGTPIYEDEIREDLRSRWNVPTEKIRSLTTVEDIMFHRDRKALERYYGRENGIRKAYLFVAPDYGNLGDHAIAHAERMFFVDRLGMELVEIPVNKYKEFAEVARRHIQPGDLVLITGGGFLGSLWPNTEQMSRHVVSQYPGNPIVILPQTLYWERSKRADVEAARTRAIYEAHENLTICARDRRSLELVREYYPNSRVIMVPDMVLSCRWDEFFEPTVARAGALVCLKQDKESILGAGDKSCLLRIGERLCGSATLADTCRQESIHLSERLVLLRRKLNEFRSASLCITDRLHGVIFSAVAETPCVALSNCNHKIRESVRLIEYLPYIRFAESLDAVEPLAREAMAAAIPRFDDSPLEGHFAELEAMLRKVANTKPN
jgi:pyruvyl transferase EpsI